ncbi:MAG: Ldh family oxidoreductase [Variibacter sp.]|nr:Ldh family oxidoreductase [Variibacter sp.]
MTAQASTQPSTDPGASPRRVPARAIAGLIADAFASLGVPAADAEKVASLMVEADLTGADAHGVFRLPQYVRRMKGGAVNPRANIRVERTAAATALVDGDNGLGHLVMARAADTAIALAREAGIGWVGVRRSNHAGTAGIYAAMPVEHGMIGIYSVVASANHMAPWGGAEMLLGTNPLGVGIPAGEEPPLVLDFATTVVSYGTVKACAMEGRPMPEGWMVDRTSGAPLTDPNRSHEGMLLPIGGYKGAGLALVLGLLAGPLNRAAFGRDVIDFNADEKSETNTGHFMVALDIARFLPLDAFKAEMDRHLRDLRASKRLPGFDSIRLPGDRRHQCKLDRAANGVPVSPALMRRLDELATELGIAPLFERA